MLRDRELAGKRANHHARHIERRRYLFAPSALFLFQVIEHTDAYGKGAIFLDDARLHARKIRTGSILEEVHWPARSCSSRYAHRQFLGLAAAFHQRLAQRINATSTARISGLDMPSPSKRTGDHGDEEFPEAISAALLFLPPSMTAVNASAAEIAVAMISIVMPSSGL